MVCVSAARLLFLPSASLTLSARLVGDLGQLQLPPTIQEFSLDNTAVTGTFAEAYCAFAGVGGYADSSSSLLSSSPPPRTPFPGNLPAAD